MRESYHFSEGDRRSAVSFEPALTLPWLQEFPEFPTDTNVAQDRILPAAFFFFKFPFGNNVTSARKLGKSDLNVYQDVRLVNVQSEMNHNFEKKKE